MTALRGVFSLRLPSTPLARRPSLVALLFASSAVFLWSTAFIITKAALSDVPPITMVALRNSAAFLLLLAVGRLTVRSTASINWGGRNWLKLLIMGLCQATASATSFYVLSYLPVATISFYMNSTPLVVALLGIFLLREKPTWVQGLGVAVVLLGTYIFFPTSLSPAEAGGALIVIAGQATWGYKTVLVRDLMQRRAFSTLVITAVPTGVSGVIILALALLVDGPPRLDLFPLLVIVYLASICFALPQSLWNQALRVLPAFQVSIMGNTQPLQAAILAWIFLGEALSPNKIAGMIIVMAGVSIVQWHNVLTGGGEKGKRK